MKTNHLYKSLLLSIPFIFAFFIVRSIPVEPCDFLHEETYNEEGELDYCGSDETGFVDLSVRRWPMKIDFRSVDSIITNKECQFEIKIEQADGSPLTSNDVALSHTKKIHLLAVDESLDDYHHIHPVADTLYDGVWHFTLTPKLAGKYSVFLDFIPTKSPRRVLLSTSFEAKGEKSNSNQRTENLTYHLKNLKFELTEDKKASTDQEKIIILKASDEMDRDINFHPVMGAFAHMVAFDENLSGFAHLHPITDEIPSSQNTIYNGPLSFSFTAPKSGIYRLWAQVKTTIDEELFIPFDFEFGS